MRTRTTTVMGVLGLACLPLLAACDKPQPGVTVTSGHSSSRLEAACWSRDSARAVDVNSCSTAVGTLSVAAGTSIGISVDKAVADAGWEPAIGSNSLVPAPLHSTYYRFALGEQDLANGSLSLRVVALDKTGKAPRGIWTISLKRA